MAALFGAACTHGHVTPADGCKACLPRVSEKTLSSDINLPRRDDPRRLKSFPPKLGNDKKRLLHLGDTRSNKPDQLLNDLKWAARVSSSSFKTVCDFTGFKWTSLFVEGAHPRNDAMCAAPFQRTPLQEEELECVRQFVSRGDLGMPFGYTYISYTVEEGFGISAARVLPAKTLVALYHGSFVAPGTCFVLITYFLLSHHYFF